MAAHLYVQAPGERRRPPPEMLAQIHLDEPGATGYPLHHDLGQLLAAPRVPDENVQSFLLLGEREVHGGLQRTDSAAVQKAG